MILTYHIVALSLYYDIRQGNMNKALLHLLYVNSWGGFLVGLFVYMTSLHLEMHIQIIFNYQHFIKSVVLVPVRKQHSNQLDQFYTNGEE